MGPRRIAHLAAVVVAFFVAVPVVTAATRSEAPPALRRRLANAAVEAAHARLDAAFGLHGELESASDDGLQPAEKAGDSDPAEVLGDHHDVEHAPRLDLLGEESHAVESHGEHNVEMHGTAVDHGGEHEHAAAGTAHDGEEGHEGHEDGHDAHASGHGHEHGCGEHGDHGSHHSPWDDEMALIMIIALILLTIAFEKAKHMLVEESQSESQKLVVNALFGEVTVLGFIALITYFLIKSGFFTQLGKAVYGDKEHALHLFEDVHFGLFFTMMIYLILVIWLLYVQGRIKRKWMDLEEKSRRFMHNRGLGQSRRAGPSVSSSKVKPPSLPMPRDEYLEWRYNGGGRIPVGFEGVLQKEDALALEDGDALNAVADRPDDDELHKYMLLRARFIWGFNNGEGRKNSSVDLTFDFGRYLENCMGETLTELVIVHEVTWLFVLVSMVVAYGLFGLAKGSTGVLYVFVLFGFVLVAAMLWILFHLNYMYRNLSPPPTSNLKQVLTGHHNSTPAYEKLPMEKNLSKHDRLFPLGMGSYGPDFFAHFLRTTLLIAAIYLVGITVVFLPIMIETHLEVFFPICITLVMVTCALIWPIIGRLTIVTSVGLHKRPDVVEHTMREVQLERSIKTIKILAAIQSQMRKLKKLQGGGARPTKELDLNPKQRRDLQDAFVLFDEDKSGTIDAGELYNLLKSLGQQIEPAEAERLILEMDTGNDGHVNFDEFCAVMAVDDDAPVTNPKHLADEMFHMLDKDNSGAITLREFRDFLQQLPINLNEDDVDSMLHDIFGDDDDASITLAEFEHFLTRKELN